MISASRSWHGRSRTARLLLVVAAFVGLFAMHGLGDHGTAHQEMSAPATATTASPKAHASHGSAVSQPPNADAAGAANTDAHKGDGSGMLGLCLAVLAGAVLALAWLRSRTPLSVIRRWPYRNGPDLRATMLRDRDPPCLFELSIQRC